MAIFKQSSTFQKWHGKLKDAKAKALIAMRLHRLAGGNAGDVAPVGDGIGELRNHYGPGYRIYFQQRNDVLILLLCGGDKGSQTGDIKAAKQIAAQWSDDEKEQ
jgi:putative addiction module killer protein